MSKHGACSSSEIVARRLAAKQLKAGYVFVALHMYCDAYNQPLYWRIRLQHAVTQQKWIRPMHCNARGNLVLGEPVFPERKPLYRLPDILTHMEATIWIVEGEKCVDALSELGLIATTSGGVESAKTTDWLPLKNRAVIIWPDNDAAGWRYAQAVNEQLQFLASSIHCLDIAALQLPDKGDCVDWLLQHPQADKAMIEQLVTELPQIDINQTYTINHDSALKNSKIPSSVFRVTAQGVYYEDSEPLRICSRLEIKALVRDQASENWGRLLVFQDADAQEHTWAMPMQMLKGSGEELRSELLRMGLEISANKRARNLLLEYITSSQPQARARCVTKTGWHQNVFVFPHHTIGEGKETVLYQSENPVRDYGQAGTLPAWQTHLAAYCEGNPHLALAVSAAFAAMLLYPAGLESGGIHFVGESSTGKTTALRIAASVYGAPDYLHRWRATTNGLEALAALRSDTLLVLDELAQVDPNEAGEIAYMLANGSGKTRADRTGTFRTRYEWRLLFLSAGEIGLAQHMHEVGKKVRAGQQVRLVDISADAGSGLGIFKDLHGFASAAEFSKALSEACQRYYGTAATAFLERITMPDYCSTLPQFIREHSQRFIKQYLPTNASGQVHRVCERFALIAAAGELATENGITGWIAETAALSAAYCYQAWLERRGTLGNQEHLTALAQIRGFFEAHGESRFTEWNADHTKTINRAGFRRTHPTEGIRFYVLPQVFRTEVCQGLDYNIIVKLLMSMGWLSVSELNQPYRREYLPGIGRCRCYVFTPKLWEDEPYLKAD